MAFSVDPLVAQLAHMAASQTGLNYDVVLAHWQAEETVTSANWPNNNPAGIRPGNSAVDALSTGVNNGFDVFPTPAAGAQAYAILINTDVNYAGVRAAIKTGNSLNELNAIIQSPWDTAHYGGGVKLYSAYSTVTGKPFAAPSGLTFDPSVTYAIGDSPSSVSNQQVFPATNYSVVANSQRTGNVLYSRRYRALIASKSGIALDVSDLHCIFNIQYIMTQPTAFSSIEIYNLNPTTENFLIQYGDRFVLEAGYEGTQYGVIFDGEVVEPIRDKPDNVSFRLTVNAIAGNSQANKGFVNFTAVRGQSARSIVENIATKATVPTPLGDISPRLSTIKLPRGRAYFGMTKDILRQIAQANNMTFHMHDGKINLIHMADAPKGSIIDLTAATGLIGQPSQNEQGVNFQCLLNPSIQIGSMVHIDNSLIQAQTYQIGSVPLPLDSAGIYRVVQANHAGDSRGNDWYTNCIAVSQSGLLPSPMSTLTSNPF